MREIEEKIKKIKCLQDHAGSCGGCKIIDVVQNKLGQNTSIDNSNRH